MKRGTAAMIEVKDIKKEYDFGLVKALNGVSFEVRRGEAVSLMGPSGCGKSTLLNIIGTLDRPTSGGLWIDGQDMLSHRDLSAFRAGHIGFVFQFHNLIASMSLLENTEIPMHALKVPRKTRRARAMALLDQLGLAERMNFLPSRVSGGERQRAAIARALANDPQILIADEPTGSVDATVGDKILEYLYSLCRTRGLTLLIATHNQDIAMKADRTLHMRDGLLI